MLSFRTVASLEEHLKTLKDKGLKIGLVPTMGALHQGHISLVNEAKKPDNIVICSIFVNPKQFNDPKDLENYPQTIEQDIELLLGADCDILFRPVAEDVFSRGRNEVFDFSGKDSRLEGEHRPGHFEGVATIVKILFDIVQPDHAYFGQKDYQQCLIVESLVKQFRLPVKLHYCPVIREPDGLAMSSRNRRIAPDDRPHANIIYQTLHNTKSFFDKHSIKELRDEAIENLGKSGKLSVEYFDIVNANTLATVKSADDADNIIAVVAVKLGQVRLIDNLFLKKQETDYI